MSRSAPTNRPRFLLSPIILSVSPHIFTERRPPHPPLPCSPLADPTLTLTLISALHPRTLQTHPPRPPRDTHARTRARLDVRFRGGRFTPMKRLLGLLLERLVSASKNLRLEKCWKQKKPRRRETAVSDGAEALHRRHKSSCDHSFFYV